jgi:hypothetical protein
MGMSLKCGGLTRLNGLCEKKKKLRGSGPLANHADVK